VPKTDTNDLPRWVNDYRVLNANTVLDAFPVPRVDDILADCAQATVWSKCDMCKARQCAFTGSGLTEIEPECILEERSIRVRSTKDVSKEQSSTREGIYA
jgi:hypothetical protein